MDETGKTNLGRLFLAGCGGQVGILFSIVTVVGVLLSGFLCAFSNVVSIVVTQSVVSYSTSATAEAVANGEIEALRGEIVSLVSQIESLQANNSGNSPVNYEPTPAAPALPEPIVIAHQGTVNLRSGPGLDYNKVGTLEAGDSLEIVGRNSDTSWWLVSAPEGLAWVAADVVVAYSVSDNVPVVSIPALLAWPAVDKPRPAPNNESTATPGPTATPMRTPTPELPTGTPTATAAESRIFVEDTVGYKDIRAQLRTPPESASFSPKGDQIAIIEGIKLYTVAGDGSNGRILFADDEDRRPVGGAVWSPDGEYIAFVVHFKHKKCLPCRSVVLARLSDGEVRFLETPDNLDAEAPRWTQDGRLLVLVHPMEPADGTTYVYDIYGHGQVASGTYVLSSSHDGQRWLPWRPGRVWRAGVSERSDTYYSD